MARTPSTHATASTTHSNLEPEDIGTPEGRESAFAPIIRELPASKNSPFSDQSARGNTGSTNAILRHRKREMRAATKAGPERFTVLPP
jgi:hypothetical protein